MPAWIHNRAEHILAKNPSMPESEAFGIATQQGHAAGHTPKGFGTAEGRSTAKAKFSTPKDDEKRANPGHLSSPKLAGANFTHVISVRATASGAGSLRDILHNIQQNGTSGHSFGVVTTDKPARHIGSWDGDGSDHMDRATMRKVGQVLAAVLKATGLGEKLGFSSSAYGGQPAQNGPGMKGQSQIPAFTAPPIAVKEATVPRLCGSIRKKEAGMGVGSGMSASQYSGPLSYGPFKQESGIPAFVAPNMTKTDPRLEAPAYATGGDKTAGAATGAMSAAGRLQSSQRLTAPKLTGFSGPSIAEISKPKGFGRPLSGALKSGI
jgi:hypothetical protein